MTSWRGLVPRSWDRVESATAQPPLVPGPTRVRDEDVVEEDLVELGLAGDWTSGLTSTPGACMSTTR